MLMAQGLNPSKYSAGLLTNTNALQWQQALGINTNGGTATNAIATTNGFGVGTTISNLNAVGSSTIGSNGVVTIYNAVGDGSGLTNLTGIGKMGTGSPQGTVSGLKGQTYLDQSSGAFWVNTNATVSSWLQLIGG